MHATTVVDMTATLLRNRLLPGKRPATPGGHRTRLRLVAAYGAAVAMTPYLFIKVSWVLGALLGLLPRGAGFSLSGWVALNTATILMSATGIALALALARPWGMRIPARPLLAAAWIGAGLVVSFLPFLAVSPFLGHEGPEPSGDPAAMPGWEAALVQASVTGLGVGLAIALPLYLRERRPAAFHGRLGDAAARPRRLVARSAVILAAATGLLSLSWTLGSPLGLSHPETRDANWHLLTGGTAVWALAGAWATWALANRRPSALPTWVAVTIAWVSSGMLFAWSAWKLPLTAALAANPEIGAPWPENLAVAATQFTIGIVAGAAMLHTLHSSITVNDRKPSPGRPGHGTLSMSETRLSRPQEVHVRRALTMALGVVLVIAGAIWTLQGLDLLGQSGGMNGNRIWAVLGPITALGGLALLTIGIRTRSSPNDPPTRP